MAKEKKLTIEQYNTVTDPIELERQKIYKWPKGLYNRVIYNRKSTKIASYSEKELKGRIGNLSFERLTELIAANDIRIIKACRNYFEKYRDMDFDVAFLSTREVDINGPRLIYSLHYSAMSILQKYMADHCAEIGKQAMADYLNNSLQVNLDTFIEGLAEFDIRLENQDIALLTKIMNTSKSELIERGIIYIALVDLFDEKIVEDFLNIDYNGETHNKLLNILL